ncbi:MAG: hypothetical protein KGI50_07845, partial [Patescibacteria group bacterium]|nr:hypothetical protein [Patescibacteria group bacterium]
MNLKMELKGLQNVKQMFKDIGHELSPSQVRGILSDAGHIIAKEARNEVELTGEIGELFKRDIGVYRDHKASNKSAEFVLVGPRFRQYSIHGKDQKVALIAQHETLGFHQTERLTTSGARRGKVAKQVHNPILDAMKL